MTHKPFQVVDTNTYLDSSEVNTLITAASLLETFKQHFGANYPNDFVGITLNNSFNSKQAVWDQNLILTVAPIASDIAYKMLTEDPCIKLVFENHKHTHWIIAAEAASPSQYTSDAVCFPTYSEAHEGLRCYLKRYGIAACELANMPTTPIALHKHSGVHFNPYVAKLKRPIIDRIKLPTMQVSKPQLSEDLRTRVLRSIEAQSKLLLSPIVDAQPLLIRETDDLSLNPIQNILYPNTLNFIQGKSGTHKSRLAGELVSGLLNQANRSNPLKLRLHPHFRNGVTVLYVDTERNVADQFPRAMQSILGNAGCLLDHAQFRILSLAAEFSRKERVEALKLVIEEIRKTSADHLVVFIDVITDLVQNFNEPQQCMELIDYQNQLVNQHDVTFVNVIHENPNSDKARGHLGSELHNKASNVLQVSHKGTVGDENLYEVNFKKQRDDAPYKPFAIKYCNETKGLQLATAEATQLKNQQGKASIETVCALLGLILIEPKNRQELLDELTEHLGCSERTIEAALKTVLEEKRTIIDEDAVCYYLHKTKGKSVQYELKPE
jgi:archaellum biogenesis ATPase FlaH